MENEFRFLEFEGIQIVTFIEGHKQDEHLEYHNNNVLIYVEKGKLNIKDGRKLYTITKRDFCIVRKYTELVYSKDWDENEEYAVVKAMMLQDNLIQTAIMELGHELPKKGIKESVINLKNNPILMGLYNSLTLYITENQIPNKHLMFLKTKEALLGIIQSSPEHLAIFHEFSKPVKASLKEFMPHHIYSNYSLAILAKLSGRSLSTFNRDFKKTFQTSPHSWILKQRLKKAKSLLTNSNKKASEIYIELGFKDLAHFSKVFKKEYKVAPSQIKKK